MFFFFYRYFFSECFVRRFCVVIAICPVEVLRALPFSQFSFAVDVNFIAEKLIEFLTV